MNFIKKTLLCTLAITAALLGGCARESETVSSSDTSGNIDSGNASDISDNFVESTSDVKTDGTENNPEISDEKYLKWGIPNIVRVSEDTTEELNAMLAEKGYDFGVKFVELDFGSYKDALMADTANLDIASAGLDNEKDISVNEIMRSGIFEDLDERLDGSELYSLIPPQLWSSVTLDGSIYTVPSAGHYSEGAALYGDGSVSLNEGFTADELYNALGGEGKFLFAETDGLAILELCGFEVTHEGMLIASDGKAISPLDCAECVDMLRVLNKLKSEGRLVTNISDGDNGAFVLAFGNGDTSANVPLISVKSRVKTIYGASTGILKSSEKKDAAFQLLEALRTDGELANLLIYGAGYSEKDGAAVDKSGAPIGNGFMNKVVFGLNGNLLSANDIVTTFGTTEELFDAYNNTIESKVCGMIFDNYTSELKQALYEVGKLWQSADFETALSELRQRLDETGIQKLTNEVNEKISSQS